MANCEIMSHWMVSGPKSYKSKNVQNTNQGVPKPNQNSLQLKGSVDIVPERWNQTLCLVQEKNTDCSIRPTSNILKYSFWIKLHLQIL